MLLMPAALMGCGGDDNGGPADTGPDVVEAGHDAGDAASDARDADAGDAPADVRDAQVEADAAVTLTGVQVTPAAMTIHAAATQQYTATANFSDGTTKDVTATATWTSSDMTVVTITAGGLATGVKQGNVTITASYTASGVTKSGTAALVVSPAMLTSVSVTPATAMIVAGSTQQFTAKANYADGTNADVTSQATWTSSTAATATVSALGLANGLAMGTTTITAAYGGMSGTAMLTVSKATVSSLSVSPTTGMTSVGGADVPFTARALLSDNTSQDVTANAMWSSSAAATATINATTGVAHPVAPGSVTITATFGGKTGTATLVVSNAALVSLVVTPPTPNIPAGTTQQFTATATFMDGTMANVTSQASWQSSAPATATIAATGVATAVAAGTTNITASFGGKTSAAAVLTVGSGQLTSISIAPATGAPPVQIPLGVSVTFVATGHFSDNTTADISSQVTWASSAPGVLTFNGATATGAMAAPTNVTASLGTTTSNSISVLVTVAQLASIAVTPTAPATLHAGATQAFKATGTFSDGTTQDITSTAVWTSGTPATATISNTAGSAGVATGVASGTTAITAASGMVTSPAVTLTVNGTATLVSITLTPSTLTTLPIGSTQQFTATGNYSDGTSGDVSSTVTWSATDDTGNPTSDFTAVNGLVTGVQSTAGGATGLPGGQGLVRAQQGNVIGAAPVKVTATTITAIAVTCTSPNATTPTTLTCIPAGVGLQVSCTALATFSDTTHADVTGTASWASTSATVATPNGVSNGAELITIAAAGSTNITATQGGVTSPNGGTNAITAQVETQGSGLTITNPPTGNTLSIGQINAYSAVATYSGTAPCAGSVGYDVTTLATWTSSDATVATVSNAAGSKGTATAVAAGTANIAAAFGGQSGTAALTVNSACIQSVSIDQVTPTYPIDVLVPLTVKAVLSNSATPVQLDSSVTPGSWGGAPVTATGTAWVYNTTGLSSGMHALTFTVAGCGGVNAQATVNVTIDTTTQPTGLSITSSSNAINLGGSVTYTATASYPTFGTFNVSRLSTWSTTPATGSVVFSGVGLPSLDEKLQHSGTTGAGTYTVSAVYRNQTANTGLTISGTNTITSIDVTSADVGSPTTTPLDAVNGAPVGLPIAFGVTIHFSDNTTSNNLSGVTFASSTAGVLSAFNGNVATTTAAGTTTVTATINGVTSTAGNSQTVIVNTDTLNAITVAAFGIPENSSQAVPVSGTYAPGGQVFDIGALVTSSSANSAIVGVATTSSGTTATSHSTTGPVTLTFLKDGVTGTATATVNGGCITAITLSPSSVTSLPSGSTQTFTATASLSDGTTNDVTSGPGSATWTSSDSTVLVSNGSGSFTAPPGGNTGPATVTATMTGAGVCAGGSVAATTVNGTASVNVSAAAVASIALDTFPSGLTTIPVGESRQLKVTATLTDGTTADVTSSSSFVSGITSEISVNSAGVATANAAGAPTITASFTPAGGTTQTAQLVLTAQACGAPVVTIAITAPGHPGNIAVGQSESFTAQAVYTASGTCTGTAGERTFDVTSLASFHSDATAVATITSLGTNAGQLNALTAGTAHITATYKTSTSNSVNVTPVAVTLTTLVISAGSPVPKGGSEVVTVTPTWSDGGNYPTTVSFSFDSTKVSIDSQGNLTAVAVGSTPITATAAGITSNTITVNVTAACVSAISLASNAGTTLPVGVPFKVTATCQASDNSTLPCNPTFTRAGSVATGAFSGSTNGQFEIGGTGAGTVTATILSGNGGCEAGVAGQDATAQLTITGGTATLLSIALTPATASIPEASNQAYVSQGSYGGGTGAGTYDISSVATLHSSNTTVATVNALPNDQTLPSTVTSLQATGTTNITSTDGSVTSNAATLTVNTTTFLTGIAITADENLVGGGAGAAAYPAGGYNLQLHATGTNNDGSSAGDLTSQVTWSLNTPVVTGTTLSSGGLFTTGTAAGAQVVTATLGSVSHTFTVTIDAGTITAVNIVDASGSAAVTSVANGATASYGAQATIGGSSYWVTTNFTWASSNTAVATIVSTGSTAGTLTAVAATGSTNVTATRGSLTAGPLAVNASNATPSTVVCTPATVPVAAGATVQLRVNVTFSDNSVIEETTSTSTTWSSPNLGVASFPAAHNGVLLGVAAGTVTIQPTFLGVQASVANACVVTVQ